MNGKIVGTVLIGSGVLAGGGLYYLQVFHFYERLDPAAVALQITMQSGETLPLAATVQDAIDATSSPIRFRACFTLDAPLPEDALTYPDAEPLNAPFWFDCFDAGALGADLASGAVTAYLAAPDVAQGVDSIIALYPDGRGFAWHQLNPEFAE